MKQHLFLSSVICLLFACSSPSETAEEGSLQSMPEVERSNPSTSKGEMTKTEGIQIWSQEMNLIADEIDSVRDDSSADQAVANIKAIQMRLADQFSGVNDMQVRDYTSLDPQQLAGVQARMGQALMGLQMRNPKMMKKITAQLKEMPDLGMPAIGQ